MSLPTCQNYLPGTTHYPTLACRQPTTQWLEHPAKMIISSLPPSPQFYIIKAACWNKIALRFCFSPNPELMVLKGSNHKGLADSYFSGFKNIQQVRDFQHKTSKVKATSRSLVLSRHFTSPALLFTVTATLQSVVNNWLGSNLSTNTSWQYSFNTRLVWKCKQLVVDLVAAVKKPAPSDAPEH